MLNNLFCLTCFKSFQVIRIFIVFVIVFHCSCKKFVEIPAPDHVVLARTAFETDQTAISTITGIYSDMMSNGNFFSGSGVTLFSGMAADELYYYTPSFRDEYVNNEITIANHGTIENNFWSPGFRFIYAANSVIEGITESKTISGEVKKMLLGEALFVRAFCYFYLVNLFGDVPLITGTNYLINASLHRESKTAIYELIINDLIKAQNLLSNNYTTIERVRPNKWAVTALLSRVYLYNGEWEKAEVESNAIIVSGVYSLVSNLNSGFLKGSAETIWQLQPVNPVVNTYEGNFILPASVNAAPTYLLTNHLLRAFEQSDLRRAAWTASRVYLGQTVFYPYKYKVYGNNAPVTEYYVVLRLAEQYLIRAEARANLNNVSGAIADLNIVRKRAGLGTLASNLSNSELLNAIEKERRVELFAEWGHRWFDLKRTQRADAVISKIKPLTWQPTDQLWPIPVNQLNSNPKLTQNPGY